MGSEPLDDETLIRLAVNVGTRPADHETCSQLAEQFDQSVGPRVSGRRFDLGLRVTANGPLVSPEELANHPDLETVLPYQVDDAHLREGAGFLRHCGGFEVW